MNQIMYTAKQTFFYEEKTENNEDRSIERLRKTFFPKGIGYVAQTVNTCHRIYPKLSYRLAASCLSVAIKRKFSAEDHNFYKSGNKKVYQIGKKRCYTYSYGKGPKVLLIHGWASSGSRWKDHVYELVKRGFTAVILDAPGHGNSPGFFLSVPGYIKSVKAVLDSEEQWHSIISHSMGSLAGFIALSQSDKTLSSKNFVAMSTFADCEGLLARYGKCIGFDDRLMKAFKSWVVEWTGKPLEYFSMINRFPDRKLNVQLIYDTNDMVVPAYEAYRIETFVPIAETLKVTNVGHGLRCQDITNKIMRFIVST